MSQDSGDEKQEQESWSGGAGNPASPPIESSRRVAKTLLFSPRSTRISRMFSVGQKSRSSDPSEPSGTPSPGTVSGVRPPAAERVAKTLLEFDAPIVSTSHPDEQVAETLLASEQPAASEANSGPTEKRQHFVAKTRLDQSVLAETVLKFEVRKKARAEEEAKERANQPAVEFHPVDSKKLARKCAWVWDDDDSKDKFRYCPKCKLQAYNFEGMELPAAEALIFKRENLKSPILFKRADGKFMTQDCPVEIKRRRRIIVTSIVAGFFVSALLVALILMPPPAISPKSNEVESDESSPVDSALNVKEHDESVVDAKPIYIKGADGKLKRKRPTFGPDDQSSYWN